MKRMMQLLAATLVATSLFAEPTVSNLSAHQRYPWNGLVDIEFTVSGLEEGKVYEPVAVATNLDNKAALPVNSLELWQGGASTAAPYIVSNGTYRMIWDAPSDVGEVVVSNLLFCLDVDVRGGEGIEMGIREFSFGRTGHIGRSVTSVRKTHGMLAITSGGVIRLGISAKIISGWRVMDR